MNGHERIPFNRSSLVGREQDYIAEAMRIGQIAGDQSFGHRCEALLRDALHAERVLLTTSCTHALEMCAFLLDVAPGDEVIVPSFSFVSAANAFAIRGARIVFVDATSDTMNADPADIARKIGPRTKAIVVVHYGGVACDMDAIMKISRESGVTVVEDNAHGLFGSWHGRPLGCFGAMATLSFHETKNFTCGEGGALVLNDPRLVERAEIVREKGTNRSQFFRGQVDKYSWVSLGSSYVISDLLAAFLYAQLEQREAVQRRRGEIWRAYDSGLRNWAREHGVGTPYVPPGAEHPSHLYYLVLPSLQDRQALIAHLKARGILAVFHYLPLNLSKMGRLYGGQKGDCPVAEELSDRLVRLPFFVSLSSAEQEDIIEAILEFQPHRKNET